MNDRPKSPGKSPGKTQWADRAAAWNRTAPEGASTNDGPNQLLIEWAGIAPGHAALDLASGTGEPAISIALHVGEAGSVTALDANREMLAGAERRAAHLGLANMEFVVVPMEDMAFADHRFDAVTCRFGLMHADSPWTRSARRGASSSPAGGPPSWSTGRRRKITNSWLPRQLLRLIWASPRTANA